MDIAEGTTTMVDTFLEDIILVEAITILAEGTTTMDTTIMTMALGGH
jgi:hypothetical protein